MFSNEQIAHDIAIARMAGKQLPAKELVDEYRSCYKTVLEYLNSESQTDAPNPVKLMRRPF